MQVSCRRVRSTTHSGVGGQTGSAQIWYTIHQQLRVPDLPLDVSLTDWASCPQQVTLVMMMRPVVSTAQSMGCRIRVQFPVRDIYQLPKTTQPGHPFVGRRNISRRAVTPWFVCGCRRVKLCDPLITHGPYLSAFAMVFPHDKALYRSPDYCYCYICQPFAMHRESLAIMEFNSYSACWLNESKSTWSAKQSHYSKPKKFPFVVSGITWNTSRKVDQLKNIKYLTVSQTQSQSPLTTLQHTGAAQTSVSRSMSLRPVL